MRKMIQRAKNQKGFTLVELMVVVVIIGILVMIAVPIFNGIQQNAKDKAHLANLRTIDGAIAMYLAENPDGTPTKENLEGAYLQEWPTPPEGNSNNAVAYTVSSNPPYKAGFTTAAGGEGTGGE